MDKEKAIEKIKKCLALGKSSNSNEAAIAMRMAVKLMEQFGLTEAEVEASHIGMAQWKSPYGFDARSKAVPGSLTILVGTICKAFGVRAVNSLGWDGKVTVEYWGSDNRVQLAVWCSTVVMRAMNRDWLAYRDNYLGEHARGQRVNLNRESFRHGWLAPVLEQVDAMALTETEQQLVQRKMDMVYSKLHKGTNKPSKTDLATFGAGMEKGKEFKLHRPMGQTRLGLGHDGDK